MGIARSVDYGSPVKPVDDTSIVEAMFSICDEFEFYDYRRVGAALRQQGLVINHKKTRRLVRQHNLHPKVRHRFVATAALNTQLRHTGMHWLAVISSARWVGGGIPMTMPRPKAS
ncbi:IS3 family transposase [Shinella sp.]